jgi:hypothetical protein
VITKGLGVYGTDYMKRAVVAAFRLAGEPREDAVYPYAEVDGAGQKLTGAHDYTLSFAKGETPPVNGFWSITMYEIDQGWWFVPNALNKFTVSPRNDLKYNPDGSLTLYFQHASPGRRRKPTGCPPPRARSSRCSACTGRRRRRPRSSTAPGRSRRSPWRTEKKRPDTAGMSGR